MANTGEIEVYPENEVLELTSEEQAELDELAKEAESQLTEETLKEGQRLISEAHPEATNSIPEFLTNLAGTLRNSSPRGALTILHTREWGGTFITNPPRSINRNSNGTFTQTGLIADLGCKAAVVYIGRNQANQECGWLFAWQNARGSQRKVYAQCGLRSRFNNVNWNTIENQLDRARSSTSVRDNATNTRISAQMTGSTGQSVTTATFT